MAKYGMNRVTLIGNLGHDPELKYLDQGIAYTTVRIACTDRIRGKDGNYQDRTEWISVNLWRGQAETIAKYCRRGSTVSIEGRLRTQQWETAEGEKRSRTLVEGQKLILLDSRPVGGSEFSQPVAKVASPTAQQSVSPSVETPVRSAAQAPASPQNTSADASADIDDLPF